MHTSSSSYRNRERLGESAVPNAFEAWYHCKFDIASLSSTVVPGFPPSLNNKTVSILRSKSTECLFFVASGLNTFVDGHLEEWSKIVRAHQSKTVERAGKHERKEQQLEIVSGLAGQKRLPAFSTHVYSSRSLASVQTRQQCSNSMMICLFWCVVRFPPTFCQEVPKERVKSGIFP
jgi:hypothetical protein